MVKITGEHTATTNVLIADVILYVKAITNEIS